MESDEELLSASLLIRHSGPKKAPQVLAAVIVWTAPLAMGFSLGYSSPAIPQLVDQLHLSSNQTSWFASLLAVGALLGGPFAGFVIEKLGRKYGIMLSGLPFVVGWFLIAYTTNVYVLYLGRVLTGFGTGMVSLSAPTYIAEASSKDMRGLLGGGFQLSVVIGVLAAFCFGIPLSYKWLAIMASFVCTAMVLLMLLVPETPRWYFGQGNGTEAVKSLKWLRGGDVGVDEECAEIEASIVNQGESVTIVDMCTYPNLYKPLLISVALMFFQQFGGVNAVIFFSDSIFKEAGFATKSQQEVASVILALAQVVFTLVACIFMDRAGRRVLLIIAGITMAFSCVTFSLYYILTENHVLGSEEWYMKALSVGSLGIYISGFSIGWGPIPWLIMSEIFPAKARGVSSGIATASNWTFAFIVTRFFQPLEEAITAYGTFAIFAGVNILAVIFVALFLPETKGKSLEDIERHFIGDTQYGSVQTTQDEDE